MSMKKKPTSDRSPYIMHNRQYMICRDTFLLHKLKQPSIPIRCYVRTATAPTLPHNGAEVTINN